MIPIDQQIAEVKRELAMRAAVYPGLVTKKKMRQGEADLHVARMTAALKSLEWMQANEAFIGDALRLNIPLNDAAFRDE